MSRVPVLLMVVVLAAAFAANAETREAECPLYSVKLGWSDNNEHSREVAVPITLETWPGAQPLTRFEFVVGFSMNMLSFLSANEGDIFDDAGWEFFTYRQAVGDTALGHGGASSTVRIVGISAAHSSGSSEGGSAASGTKTCCTLTFLITGDQTHDYMPVDFVWTSCEDNVITRTDAPRKLISMRVFDVDTVGQYHNITDWNAKLPSTTGAPWECWADSIVSGDRMPLPLVDFYNGGIKIAEQPNLCEPADFNGNGLPFEIVDLILFGKYGISVVVGDSVPFSEFDYFCFMHAMDINRNGRDAEIADVVMLTNYLRETEDPFNYPDTSASFVVTFQQDVAAKRIVAYSPHPEVLVHCALWFDEGISATSESWIQHYPRAGSDLWLAADLFGGSERNTIVFDYEGTGLLTRVEAMTDDGLYLPTMMDVYSAIENEPTSSLPTEFELLGNYPNPFNPTTTIEYAVPTARWVSLTVYNVVGQKVRTLVDGSVSAGIHTSCWDGTNESGDEVGSGVYFYRFEAGHFVQTKKMMLLK